MVSSLLRIGVAMCHDGIVFDHQAKGGDHEQTNDDWTGFGKHVFHLIHLDLHDKVAWKKKLRREQLRSFLAKLPPCDPQDPFGNTVGFSLHAGVRDLGR